MKRLITLLLVFALAITLVACSADKNTDKDATGENETAGTATVAGDENESVDSTEDTAEAEKRSVYSGYTRTDGESGDVSLMEKYTFEGARVSSVTVDGETVDIKYDDGTSTAKAYWGDRLLFDMKWDSTGNICEAVYYYSDGSYCTYVYERDTEGRILSRKGTDDSGESAGDRKCTYNENGDLLTEVYVNGKGEKTVDTVYTYDEAGNEVSRKGIDIDDVYVNDYDEAGNLISCTNEDGSYAEYTYDADGNVESRTYYRDDGILSNIRKYTYYPSGELHTESYYYSEGELNYTYTYNYTEIEMTDAEYLTLTQILDIVAAEM